VSELLRDRSVPLVLAASASSSEPSRALRLLGLGWRDRRASQTEIGALWRSARCEILLLALGDRAIRRVAPRWLLLSPRSQRCRAGCSADRRGFWRSARLQAATPLTFGLAYLACALDGGRICRRARRLGADAEQLGDLGAARLGMLGGALFARRPVAAWLAMAAWARWARSRRPRSRCASVAPRLRRVSRRGRRGRGGGTRAGGGTEHERQRGERRRSHQPESWRRRSPALARDLVVERDAPRLGGESSSARRSACAIIGLNGLAWTTRSACITCCAAEQE
jgi:hypothetical protein